jgi:hypothetical protein
VRKLKVDEKVKCRDGSVGVVEEIEYVRKQPTAYYIRVTPIVVRTQKLDQTINSLYSYSMSGLYHREDYSIRHRYDLVMRKEKLKLPEWF